MQFLAAQNSFSRQGYLTDVKPVASSRSMDVSDVAVKHAVRFTDLNIKHTIDISPAAVSIARDIRYCVIAIVVGLSTIALVRSVLNSRKPQSPN